MGGSITTLYFMVFLVRSRYYSVFLRRSDTINGVSGRFKYVLPYFRVFVEGSRSYNVIMVGFHPGASGVMVIRAETELKLTTFRPFWYNFLDGF